MKQKITSFFIYILCAAIIFSGLLLLPRQIAESENLLADRIRKADEILVKFKNSGEISVIKIAQSDDFYNILNSYNSDPLVEYAEPNYLYSASIIPSDTYYSQQWHLQKIKAADAWDNIYKSPDIVIAIIDSGVQIDHPDLRDNIWRNLGEIDNNGIDDDKNGFIDDAHGWDFVNNTADPSPKFEQDFTEAGILHGTVVAGVAAASGNNAAGITGVTWEARLMPLKVLDDKGEGSTNKVIKAIDYAITNGADIINFSFIGFGFSQSLHDAIKRAYDAGIIIVAAAGNEQGEGGGYFLDDTPMYPACHDGENNENRVIGVAATDTLDQKADFSSYGFKCVDIAAPGLSIYSTVVYSPANQADGKYFNKYYDGYWSGTSMATPMVSAAIALIEEVNPLLNRNQVINVLLANANNINRLNPDYLNQLGKGRLNLAAAVSSALSQLSQIKTKLLIAPAENYLSHIKVTEQNGRVEQEFYSYSSNFLGGANIAAGDIDGDGIDEIITGAGFGGGPHVRIFDQQGNVKGQFFAYAKHFRGGVNVAVGDVNGDGIDEIITGAGFGGGPHVRIFDQQGNIKGQFFAYAKHFRGGVNVAVGDVNGDGINEIITGAGFGGGPQVRIFKANGYAYGQFFAYDKNFRGGVKVAVADINGGARDNRVEIITAPGPGGGPHIRIFNSYAKVLAQFFAYNSNFRGGVNVSAGDIDQDGLAEIITGAGSGGTPHVRVFETDGALIDSFYAYEEEFSGGVNVGILEVKTTN
ncbi:MAG: S8 family serine peptidase [Patescibacteria group bacterium]|nr:S8 family serine peptidase [Patescibacteria group bacterium]